PTPYATLAGRKSLSPGLFAPAACFGRPSLESDTCKARRGYARRSTKVDGSDTPGSWGADVVATGGAIRGRRRSHCETRLRHPLPKFCSDWTRRTGLKAAGRPAIRDCSADRAIVIIASPLWARRA